MNRNFKNYFVWEKPDEEKALTLEPKRNVINAEEVQAIFDTEIGGTLLSGQTAVLGNAPVQISTEINTTFVEDTNNVRNKSVEIFLDIEGAGPYTLKKDERVIGSGLQPSDFPFTDQRALTQSFTSPAQASEKEEEITIEYEIESRRENTDVVETTVQE